MNKESHPAIDYLTSTERVKTPNYTARRTGAAALAAAVVFGAVGTSEFIHAAAEHTPVATVDVTIQSGDIPGDDIYNAVQDQLNELGIDSSTISYHDVLDQAPNDIQPTTLPVEIAKNGLGSYSIHIDNSVENQ